MSSCLSGGSRTFVLDLGIVKSTSISNSTSSTTSSPSSTLSQTKKPRTPRKRPNQIYNEAAVLLSSVYPTIFTTKPFPRNAATSLRNVPSLCFFHDGSFGSSSELLLACRVTDHFGFPVHSPPLPSYNRIKSFNNLTDKISNNSPRQLALGNCDDFFDQTSSILDEEMEPVEGGIDSIMGVAASPESQPSDSTNNTTGGGGASGVPSGLGFAGLTMRRGVPALRQVDRGDWWRFPAIDMFQISPRLSNNNQDSQHKSAKNNIKKQELEPSDTSLDHIPNVAPRLMLKLNYKEVINAWSDRGMPFDEPNMSRPNAQAMLLAQIDSFGEGGAMREASVIRYKEKRRTRLLSKKIIRYQVRKVNADCRPRMKGRFVRRPTIDNKVGRRNSGIYHHNNKHK